MHPLDEFPFGSATALAAALREKRVSSVELLEAYLQRVDRFNPSLNSVVVFDRERALHDAQAADRAASRGEFRGPLHGLPMTVKESFDLARHPTTQGFPPMKENIATEDALAVQRLKAAGAVVFGKTNVPLFLGDFQSYNAIYGTTNNPWDTSRSPGGSSGGGAASLAAGLTPLEFGSDIGGSIRNPAAYCGVFGHKPTWTVIPKRGHSLARVPVAEMDLSVIGPLARHAQDIATAFRVTAGPDRLTSAGERYEFAPPPASLRDAKIAVWLDDPLAPVDDRVKDRLLAAAQALEREGAKVDYNARPAFDAKHAQDVYLRILWGGIGARQGNYDELRATAAALSSSDQSVAAMRLRSMTPSYKDYYDANNQREALRWAWREFFDEYHCVLAPITLTTAFAHDQSEPPADRSMTVNGKPVPYYSQLFWAGLATCSRLPATAVPAGRATDGLPVGLQVIGPEMGDETTLWLAAQLEKVCGGFVPPPGFA
ncbi:MAG TPA: amidase [Ramlibacter sp.]|nr:amidase [Ramlibacter sp.]